MISVVVPANNEASVIERCLRCMTATARPDEIEIVVVCNGCTDDTAARAREFGPPVRVIEAELASKPLALNLGDEAASGFPRFYVDADIEISTEALRDVASMLEGDSKILAAAPTAVIDYQERNPLVRSFYETWTNLPYFRNGVIGVGVYAFSRTGRSRFADFPNVISDDGYALRSVARHECGCSPRTTFKITPPRTLRGVVAIHTRARAGMYQLRAKYPRTGVDQAHGVASSLGAIARAPRLWPHAPIYLGVMFLAKLRAHYKLWRGQEGVWDRDDTSRT